MMTFFAEQQQVKNISGVVISFNRILIQKKKLLNYQIMIQNKNEKYIFPIVRPR